MVNWWESGYPFHNNPFHKGIPSIQTNNPNHQLTTSWFNLFEKYDCSQLETFPQVGVNFFRKIGNHHLVKNNMQQKS